MLHAYEGQEGPLEVELYLSPPALEVVVRDHGSGIRTRDEASEHASDGIGLPVIQALAHRVEFRDLGGGGTEVRMEFATPRAGAIEPVADEDGFELAEICQSELTDTVAMAISPTRLARFVLPRVLWALAARAHFSTDRISDTELLADALLAHVDDSVSGSRIGVAISVAPHNLELRLGPLRSGRTGALIDASVVDGLGPVIERLTDGHEVSAAGSSELLALRLVQPR